MAVQGIQVKGLKETVRKLERLGVEVADLKDVMTKVGTVVSTEAHSLAPVKSGALAASIRPSKAKSKAIVRAGSARVPYAGVQNFGGYHNITGSHFLERALAAKTDEVISTLDHGLQQLIRSAGLE